MQYLKEEVRSKILASALDEFEIHGYSKAHMRRIAEGAGVATGNIYRYYKGKKQVFEAIVEPVYKEISNMVTGVNAYIDQDIKTTIKDIAARIMDIFRKYGRELVVVTTKSQDSQYEDFTESLVQMVRKRIKDELFSEDDTGDEIMSYIIASGFVKGILTILQTCKEYDEIEALISRMLVFYFDHLEERLVVKPV